MYNEMKKYDAFKNKIEIGDQVMCSRIDNTNIILNKGIVQHLGEKMVTVFEDSLTKNLYLYEQIMLITDTKPPSEKKVKQALKAARDLGRTEIITVVEALIKQMDRGSADCLLLMNEQQKQAFAKISNLNKYFTKLVNR